MNFILTSKKAFWLFFMTASLLFILDLASYFDYISTNRYFYEFYDEYLNITYETNIPTLFSFLLDLITSLAAFLLYKENRKIGWLISGIFFLYMGLDDALQIHEYLGSYFGDKFLKDGFVSYYWQVFFDPFFMIIGVYIFLFISYNLKNIGCKICILWLFFGFLLYAIAVGLDYYEGENPDLSYLMEFLRMHHKDVIHLMRAFEEYIEMVGSVVILSVVLYFHPLKISIK